MSDHSIEPPAPASPDPDRSAPGAHPLPGRSRAPWPFYAGSALALALAVWFCIYAFGRSPDQADTSPVDDPAIVQQSPSPGSHVVRQTPVGVKLREGFDGRLTINGTPIPEAQMDGAIDPGAANFDPAYGVRPNNKNVVFFTPGRGKVITSYRTGEVNISVRFWSLAEGEKRARTVSWAVFVT